MSIIKKLQQEIDRFADERDWGQFHTPGELARAIMIEAGELNDLHLWGRYKSIEESGDSDYTGDNRDCNEIADIIIYCLRYASVTAMDVEWAIRHKLATNAQRYPIEKCKGSNKKYTELENGE
jgi:NTP pyrophosphatase (non-canonical NTP hydrolase)